MFSFSFRSLYYGFGSCYLQEQEIDKGINREVCWEEEGHEQIRRWCEVSRKLSEAFMIEQEISEIIINLSS